MKKEVKRLLEGYKNIVNENIETLSKLMDNLESTQEVDGVVIPHKLFSQIVNNLAHGVNIGTVEEDLLKEVIAVGKGNEEQDQEDEKHKCDNCGQCHTPEAFIMSLLNDLAKGEVK